MKRILSIVLIALLLAAVLPAFAEDTEIETIVTIVRTPEQTEAQRPPCFVDPTDNYVPLPETENYALNKPVISGEYADVYIQTNVNDGNTGTYWESKGWPAEMIIDLQAVYTITTVAVCLNPSSIWEARIQEISVEISTNGETYTEVSAKANHQFDPDTGNRIRIDFDPVEAAFVKVIFYKSSASRTMGAQAAEICVY